MDVETAIIGLRARLEESGILTSVSWILDENGNIIGVTIKITGHTD